MYEQRERYFKMELYPFIKNFFRKTLVQYVTVWLMRIWTYKNADDIKKQVLFHRKAKNVQKRIKMDRKRILYKYVYL